MSFDDADNPLAIEIRQEAAAAYFAACKKLAASLEALAAFDRAAALTPENTGQLSRRPELLAEAAERALCVVVQREAMKLPVHETFFEDYGVPKEVRARMGTWRQPSI